MLHPLSLSARPQKKAHAASQVPTAHAAADALRRARQGQAVGAVTLRLEKTENVTQTTADGALMPRLNNFLCDYPVPALKAHQAYLHSALKALGGIVARTADAARTFHNQCGKFWSSLHHPRLFHQSPCFQDSPLVRKVLDFPNRSRSNRRRITG